MIFSMLILSMNVLKLPKPLNTYSDIYIYKEEWSVTNSPQTLNIHKAVAFNTFNIHCTCKKGRTLFYDVLQLL